MPIIREKGFEIVKHSVHASNFKSNQPHAIWFDGPQLEAELCVWRGSSGSRMIALGAVL